MLMAGLVAGGEARLLLGARFLLVLRLPLLVRHAVDDLARLGIGKLETALAGRRAIPFREAVAAEPGEVHEVDVLHVGALAQMLHEAAEGRGFELGAGLVVHSRSLRCADACVISKEARTRAPDRSQPPRRLLDQPIDDGGERL